VYGASEHRPSGPRRASYDDRLFAARCDLRAIDRPLREWTRSDDAVFAAPPDRRCRAIETGHRAVAPRRALHDMSDGKFGHGRTPPGAGLKPEAIEKRIALSMKMKA
jgi:hypothetical protein